MIKISPSISSFPLFRPSKSSRRASEHDTRGRRSSLLVVGGEKKGYRFVSCLRRLLCTICTKAAFAAAAMCAASGMTAAPGRPPAARSPVRQLVTLRPRSVGLWHARASGKLCLFALVCLPALSLLLSDVPRLFLRIQAGFLAVVRSVRQHVAAVVDAAAAVGGSRMWYRQKPFRKQLRRRRRPE